MLITNDNISQLAWDKMSGMIPAIIQHQDTGAVLMQGYICLLYTSPSPRD